MRIRDILMNGKGVMPGFAQLSEDERIALIALHQR